MPPAQLKQAERRLKESRTINYDLIEALRAVRESVRNAGLNKLSAGQVDAEVAAVRKARTRKIRILAKIRPVEHLRRVEVVN